MGEEKLKSYCKIIMGNIGTICVSLLILTLTFLTYLGLFGELSRLTMPAQTVTVSSEGPAAEMFPDSMGQYNVLGEVYLYDRAVYKHVDREDRFIIYTGRSISYLNYTNLILRWILVHNGWFVCWGGISQGWWGIFATRNGMALLYWSTWSLQLLGRKVSFSLKLSTKSINTIPNTWCHLKQHK